MKRYQINDKEGKKLIIEKDNGITVQILEKPSQEYIANMPAPSPEEPSRDYLAEIDELKAKVQALEAERE